MKTMCMSEDVGVGSTFVRNAGFAARSPACSKSTSAPILTSGLTCASYVTSPSKRKVRKVLKNEQFLKNFFKEENHFFMATLDYESHFITTFHRLEGGLVCENMTR